MEKMLSEAGKSHSAVLPSMASLASLGKSVSQAAKEASPGAEEAVKKERERTLSLDEAEEVLAESRKQTSPAPINIVNIKEQLKQEEQQQEQ